MSREPSLTVVLSLMLMASLLMGCITDAEVRSINETERANMTEMANRTPTYGPDQILRVGTSEQRLELEIVDWGFDGSNLSIRVSALNIGSKIYDTTRISIFLMDEENTQLDLIQGSTEAWAEALPRGRRSIASLMFVVPAEESGTLQLWIYDSETGWLAAYSLR